MFDDIADFQKKWHAERLGELIDMMEKIPKKCFPNEDSRQYVIYYLDLLRDSIVDDLDRSKEVK